MEEILNYLNNYFFKFSEKGIFEISNNSIQVRGNYIKGQYILIQGSTLNDGVYKVKNFLEGDINSVLEDDNFKEIEEAPEDNIKIIQLWDKLEDEIFEGKIFSLAVPKKIENLKDEIEAWKKDNKNSVVISESFGGYSYSKQTDANGNIANWKNAFADELNPYRRIYSGIDRVKEV